MTKNVLVIDDHPVVQYGLKTLICDSKLFKEVHHCGNGREGIMALNRMEKSGSYYQLLIIDVNLSDYEVTAFLKKLHAQSPKTKVLIFSGENPKIYIRALIESGIDGYIHKSSPKEELLFAVSSILLGKKYFSSQLLDSLISGSDPHSNQAGKETLSGRESSTLSMLLKGKTTLEIAEELGIHRSSVLTYRKRAFEKIGVTNNFELYQWAMTEGLLHP